MAEQDFSAWDSLHYDESEMFVPLSEQGGNKVAHCWPFSREGFFELSQSAFMGFVNGEVTQIKHGAAVFNTGWALKQLRLVILHTRDVSVIGFTAGSKKGQLVVKDYIQGGKKRVIAYCVSPDLVNESGEYLPFTVGVSGYQAKFFQGVVGSERGIRDSQFFQEVINPITLLIDPESKTPPLNRLFFHIPVKFDKKPFTVTSTKKDVSSDIMPIIPGWDSEAVATAISEIKVGLTPLPKDKAGRDAALITRRGEVFGRIKNTPVLAQFFGQSADDTGKMGLGYLNLARQIAPQIEEYKAGLIEYDRYQESTPRYKFAMFCKEHGLDEIEPLLLFDSCNGNMQAAEKAALDMAGHSQAIAPQSQLVDYLPQQLVRQVVIK